MDEAYKTPESNLTLEMEHQPRPHWFWRLYFWLHVGMAPLLVIGILLVDNLSLFDYLDLAISPPIFVALYGFAYAKKIGVQLFWRAFSIIYPLWMIFYFVIVGLVLKIPQYGEAVEVDGWLIIDPIFAVITSCALWLYASSFNSNERP